MKITNKFFVLFFIFFLIPNPIIAKTNNFEYKISVDDEFTYKYEKYYDNGLSEELVSVITYEGLIKNIIIKKGLIFTVKISNITENLNAVYVIIKFLELNTTLAEKSSNLFIKTNNNPNEWNDILIDNQVDLRGNKLIVSNVSYNFFFTSEDLPETHREYHTERVYDISNGVATKVYQNETYLNGSLIHESEYRLISSKFQSDSSIPIVEYSIIGIIVIVIVSRVLLTMKSKYFK